MIYLDVVITVCVVVVVLKRCRDKKICTCYRLGRWRSCMKPVSITAIVVYIYACARVCVCREREREREMGFVMPGIVGGSVH